VQTVGETREQDFGSTGLCQEPVRCCSGRDRGLLPTWVLWLGCWGGQGWVPAGAGELQSPGAALPWAGVARRGPWRLTRSVTKPWRALSQPGNGSLAPSVIQNLFFFCIRSRLCFLPPLPVLRRSPELGAGRVWARPGFGWGAVAGGVGGHGESGFPALVLRPLPFEGLLWLC